MGNTIILCTMTYTGAFVAYGICFINPAVVNKIELEMGEGRISGP